MFLLLFCVGDGWEVMRVRQLDVAYVRAYVCYLPAVRCLFCKLKATRHRVRELLLFVFVLSVSFSVLSSIFFFLSFFISPGRLQGQAEAVSHRVSSRSATVPQLKSWLCREKSVVAAGPGWALQTREVRQHQSTKMGR